MTDFWEESFKDKHEMWGFEPSKSTVIVNDFFVEQKVKNVLVLGIGYGRNAQMFLYHGMTVTGIEISKTAIQLAHQHFGDELHIHHGSVTKMPFDDNLYDGIYGYAIIHFLDKKERAKLIQDCFNQLTENGFMIFAVVSKNAQIYGQGSCIDKDRFAIHGGLKMFFYDKETIQDEFSQVGLFEILEVDDIYPFYLIKCRKSNKA